MGMIRKSGWTKETALQLLFYESMLSYNSMKTIQQFYKHIIFLILILIVVINATEYFFAHQKDKYLHAQTALLNSEYETQYRYFRIMSQDIVDMYQGDSQFVTLFSQTKNADKEKLSSTRLKMYKLLKKRYKRLKNMGIEQINFHLPNNRSFLRMNTVEKFGDDLSETREDVVYTNRTHKSSEGFSIGRTIYGYRFVYPLFNKKKEYLGNTEITFSQTQLLKNISSQFIINKHFLVSKKEVDSKMWQEFIRSTQKVSVENSDYYIMKNDFIQMQNAKITALLENKISKERLNTEMQKNRAFSIRTSYNYDSIVVTALPISNIVENKTVAYLVFYTESDFLDTLALEKRYVLLLFLSIIVILFVFSIYISITQKKLREMAHFDKLTKLPNRAYFYIELEQEIKRVSRYSNSISLMFLDLDGFKAVNDTYGHNVGDELLIQVAQRLEKAVRGTDLVGRVGGDEFVILLTDIRKNSKDEAIAQSIIKSIGEEFIIHDNIIHIGVSIGIAHYPDNADNLEALVNNADNAMYEAKNNGKNNYILYKNLPKK